ncbi:MAG: gamma-glutamylcyclotransferase family protein [Pseudomonadota bacterium]
MRILRPQKERKIYYFAFGANLSPDVLSLRKIKIYETFDFVLDRAALNFTQLGFYKQHGYASADASKDQVVYGKMYLILESDARRMDYFEGVPWLKAHFKIFRETEKFNFYFYRTRVIYDGLKPTQEYLDYICNAYREMEIVPREYLDRLSQTEVLEEFEVQNETGVFVTDIESWPRFLHPLLKLYEGVCLRVVEALWNRSLVHWAIRY